MDKRPANCRFRLQDEGKSYPRSSCAACGKGIMTGLGNKCSLKSISETDPEIQHGRNATLSLTLRADSGYESNETHRISPDQWRRIVEIANE